MKLSILFIFLAVTVTPLIAQTRYDVTITVDSVERQFVIARPSGPVPPGGYPVVFMFHGTSGDGDRFYTISGWKEKGEQEKILTIYPSALEYCFIGDDGKPTRTTKWNNGDAEENKCPGEYLKDDVHFVRAMIDTITQVFTVDRSRIYASGFSNGSVFANKLAVEMSDVFAAVASVSGALNPLDSGAAARRIPIWFSIGTLDDRYISAFSQFGFAEIPFNDTALALMRPTINRYLAVLGLDTSYTKNETSTTLTYRFSNPAQADAAPAFLFSLIDGLDHHYPNGSNYPLSAPDAFWPFFSQFTTPLGVTGQPVASDDVQLYPNPTHGTITLQGTGMLTLSLSTIMGQEVFSITTVAGRRIQLPELATGLYIADVANGTRHWQSKIIVR